jgi:hypothetical protein
VAWRCAWIGLFSVFLLLVGGAGKVQFSEPDLDALRLSEPLILPVARAGFLHVDETSAVVVGGQRKDGKDVGGQRFLIWTGESSP